MPIGSFNGYHSPNSHHLVFESIPHFPSYEKGVASDSAVITRIPSHTDSASSTTPFSPGSKSLPSSHCLFSLTHPTNTTTLTPPHNHRTLHTPITARKKNAISHKHNAPTASSFLLNQSPPRATYMENHHYMPLPAYPRLLTTASRPHTPPKTIMNHHNNHGPPTHSLPLFIIIRHLLPPHPLIPMIYHPLRCFPLAVNYHIFRTSPSTLMWSSIPPALPTPILYGQL